MKNHFYKLCILGLLILMPGIEGNAQFHETSDKPSSGRIMNAFNGKFLQLEGNPTSYKKSKLVLGDRVHGGSGQFLLFSKEGDGYLMQIQFDDAGNTWGNVELEKTFKKEGAELFLNDKEVEGDNYIVHPQRFLIQGTTRGSHYIRSLDGRYLRCDHKTKKVFFTSKKPSDFEGPANEESQFEWIFNAR
ncbi:MAG: hypothetical protein ACQEQ0_08930 [Bacteroidota bacterium]